MLRSRPGRGCWGAGDPAISERIYTSREAEFLSAISHYQTDCGRKFPTWSEVLHVLLALGYRKCQSECTLCLRRRAGCPFRLTASPPGPGDDPSS